MIKKISLILIVLISIGTLNAQAWQAKNFNIDVGYVLGSHDGAFLSPGVMISGEKGVHRWLGVGAYTGFQYNFPRYSKFSGTYGENNGIIPVGGFVSFHFYQLLSDLINEEIGTKRLDIALKGGLGAKFRYRNNMSVKVGWGVSVNAKYFISKNVGLFAEVGHPLMGTLIFGVAAKF